MNKLELPMDGTIWIFCGVAFILICKIYNVLLAGDDDSISDLVIAKTLIIAIVAISTGAYFYNMFMSYTPTFSSLPLTTKVPDDSKPTINIPLRTQKLTKLVND